MGYHLIGFLAFSFVGMTVVNRILEGRFITSSDVSILNAMTVFRPTEVFGLFTVPIPNLDFFTTGLVHLAKWDYSFFGGNAGIIQFFLYSLTAALSFILFTIVIGMLYQFFSRAR